MTKVQFPFIFIARFLVLRKKKQWREWCLLEVLITIFGLLSQLHYFWSQSRGHKLSHK